MIIGLIALLISLFNSVALFKKKGTTKKETISIDNKSTIVMEQEQKPTETSAKESSRFPMLFGHKGNKIIELQKVILQIDPNALPKYGADGNLDNETTNALSRLIGKGFIKDESDWNKLIGLIP